MSSSSRISNTYCVGSICCYAEEMTQEQEHSSMLRLRMRLRCRVAELFPDYVLLDEPQGVLSKLAHVLGLVQLLREIGGEAVAEVCGIVNIDSRHVWSLLSDISQNHVAVRCPDGKAGTYMTERAAELYKKAQLVLEHLRRIVKQLESPFLKLDEDTVREATSRMGILTSPDLGFKLHEAILHNVTCVSEDRTEEQSFCARFFSTGITLTATLEALITLTGQGTLDLVREFLVNAATHALGKRLEVLTVAEISRLASSR